MSCGASSTSATSWSAPPDDALPTGLRGPARAFVVAACAVLIAACGASGPAPASKPVPPAPINLSVYVSDSSVSVSPAHIGAGPIVLVVTNQSARAQALTILDSGGSTVAATAPINPQGTTKLSVDVSPGDYTIATDQTGRTEAQRSQPSAIRPARLRIGGERPSAGGQLLEP
ncbi:MAG: hypothetical protein ACRDL5_00855 [Solirubrobacteraceae bacterium]